MIQPRWKAVVWLAVLAFQMASPAFAEPDWIRLDSLADVADAPGKESPGRPVHSAAQAGFFHEVAEIPLPARQFVEQGPFLTAPAGGYDCVDERPWQMLPEGLLYHSYLAGEKEPRFAAQWLWERKRGLVWDTTMGARWGLVRKGTRGPDGEGFQFDVEGAAMARVDPEEESDLEAVDFRAGFLGTWHYGRWRTKFGYYHISSHAGDEYIIKNNTFNRRNYVRDALITGVMYDITPELQVYGEVANAISANDGAEPWEFQFGIQYSPAVETGFRGAPFGAVNGHLRQEFDFGGSINVQFGWAWRGARNNHLFRAGVMHYNGPSLQWEFFDRYECLAGLGVWYDF